MKMRCRLAGHAPGERRASNGKLRFARCRHCGDDLVSSLEGRDWRSVPAGYRVVWKPSPAPLPCSVSTGTEDDLPSFRPLPVRRRTIAPAQISSAREVEGSFPH
jgi:hypothetical protein